MDFSIGERTERMSAGDVIYLAPGERHALTAVSPCRMQLVMVDVDKAARTTTSNQEQEMPTDAEPTGRQTTIQHLEWGAQSETLRAPLL